MSNFSVDTTLLHIRQARSPCILVFVAAAGVLLPVFGLLGGHGQHLQLVRGQAETVNVF